MIREAREADLPAIVEIYNAAIPGRLATADTTPVTVESRREWLRDRDPARYPLWVDEREGRIAGWLSFRMFYGRPAYAETAELGVYVDPSVQRQGVANDLLAQAIARAPAMGLKTLLGLVFAHNDPSVALFEKHGFSRWGHLPRIANLDGVERDVLIFGRRVAA